MIETTGEWKFYSKNQSGATDNFIEKTDDLQKGIKQAEAEVVPSSSLVEDEVEVWGWG